MKKGWFLVAVIAIVVLSGCAYITGRTAGEYIDDSTITSAINAKIIEDHDLKYFKIDVDTTKGHVMLSGFVPSKKAEERLIEMAKAVRGVKSVTSHLKIENRK